MIFDCKKLFINLWMICFFPRINSKKMFINAVISKKIVYAVLRLESRWLRPKKINYMFLRHLPCHLQPHCIKKFYSVTSIHTEKLFIDCELAV